ncbi:unnamed protein product [Phyllotreta striolata]|uniref:PR domain zinc finger protein 10 n=1 Tax=Phyllotreta striolata TaxID=444603 RepID=A0A9N9XLS4_PHYSR|nr:unnamed protein product [Phyllotreta striolata]
MDAIDIGLQDDRIHVQDVSIVETTNWNSPNNEIVNNPTLLYIAVEYVKDVPDVGASQDEVYAEFNSRVSPLDPNMSSVARYSPIYNDTSAEYNPVVIHQLVSEDGTVQNDQYISNLNATPLSNMPTVLTNNDVREEVTSKYLQMVEQTESSIVDANTEALQLIPEGEQKVELLITDEATGISYSVDAQELLVEPCLQDDERLLKTLAPDPILESDLLTLDEKILKTELNDDLGDCSSEMESFQSQAINNYINRICENKITKQSSTTVAKGPTTRHGRRIGGEPEDHILPCVYSITDKPILSRAKATLPESYLSFGMSDGETTVIAKKIIPKRSQFGPLEGVLVTVKDDPNILKKLEENKLVFLVEKDENLCRIDVTDENLSNWMMFVRKATNFEEQNLVITQENDAIYFVTTTNIAPKQELKVWYSNAYGEYYNLPVFQPAKQLNWPCFECSLKFETSDELQNHLNAHDKSSDENAKPKKKNISKSKRKLNKKSEGAVECQLCRETFLKYNYNSLKLHITQKHGNVKGTVEEYFTTINFFKCDTCNVNFKSETLLKIHNFKHNPDTSDEQRNHICPDCQKKYPTQRQLVLHVSQQHVFITDERPPKIKCSVCHKCFSQQERLLKHMEIHGSDDKKPLKCDICNKRFLNNSALACHSKTHFAEKKPFECPICKEAFNYLLNLKQHVPIHCENNCYTCPHCNKKFPKYSIIRKHIRAFHSERTHQCTDCSKIFHTLDKLRTHLLKHSDHREFLCAICGKQFKRKDKLNEHCKKVHSEERENTVPNVQQKMKKFMPKVEPTDFHRFIYKCHNCMVGFKRRGMLVNHLAKRHPDIPPDSVPELNLPILQTTRDYYCQYCDKVYKSSSKRKAHILKNHPGAALPASNRKQGGAGAMQEVSGLPNPTFSQTVGSVTTRPQNCTWCHKQYASKAKLLQHQRKKHRELLASEATAADSAEERLNEAVDKTEEKAANGEATAEEFDEAVEKMIGDELGAYDLEEESQYCHLSMNENEHFIETNDLENPNSQLYRLLTTNNGMMPAR